MERYTVEQYRALTRSNKPLKYRNKPTGGYASKKEAKRAKELQILQRIGEISDLTEQPSYKMPGLCYDSGREITYRADFSYVQNQVLVVEDVKGMKTAVYKIKKALMRYFHGIEVKET